MYVQAKSAEPASVIHTHVGFCSLDRLFNNKPRCGYATAAVLFWRSANSVTVEKEKLFHDVIEIKIESSSNVGSMQAAVKSALSIRDFGSN
jgi:hypothetical protein